MNSTKESLIDLEDQPVGTTLTGIPQTHFHFEASAASAFQGDTELMELYANRITGVVHRVYLQARVCPNLQAGLLSAVQAAIDEENTQGLGIGLKAVANRTSPHACCITLCSPQEEQDQRDEHGFTIH